MKPLSFLFLIFFTFSAIKLDAQGFIYRRKMVDSLLNDLSKQKSDSTRVRTLNKLIQYFSYPRANFDSTRLFYHEAESISRNIDFTEGVILSNAFFGLAFYYNNLPDSALFYFNKGIALAKSAKDDKSLATLHLYSGWVFNTHLINLDSSLHYFTLAWEEAQNCRDTSLLLQTIGQLSYIYQGKGNLIKSIQLNSEQCILAQKIRDTSSLFSAFQTQCEIFHNMGMYDDEVDVARKCLAIATAKNEFRKFISSYCYIAEGFLHHKQYDSVLFYTDLLQPLAEVSGNPFWICAPFYYYGQYHLDCGNVDTAKSYFARYLATAPEKSHLQAQAYQSLGKCEFKLKNFSVALRHLSTAKKIAEDGSLIMLENEIDYDLYKLYEASGDYKKALAVLSTYEFIRDSIRSTQKSFVMNYLSLQLETARKEEDIALLVKEKELQTFIAKNQNQQKKIAYLSGVIVVLLTGYLFYRYVRRKKRQNKQEILNERLRISRELHDEVGSTLSGVVMYSHLAKEQINVGKNDEVKSSLSNMQLSVGDMMNKLSDMVWLVNPEKDSFQKLIERLEEFAINIAKTKNIDMKVDLDEKLGLVNLPVETRRDIYLFCKEAINNAVKYSKADSIDFVIKGSGNKRIEIFVVDNGIGFNESSVKKGNGLINMRQRTEKMNGVYSLKSSPGQGTHISLMLKIT